MIEGKRHAKVLARIPLREHLVDVEIQFSKADGGIVVIVGVEDGWDGLRRESGDVSGERTETEIEREGMNTTSGYKRLAVGKGGDKTAHGGQLVLTLPALLRRHGAKAIMDDDGKFADAAQNISAASGQR